MENNRQLSVDVINERISFSFTINSNCQNDKCSVHQFLRDVCKKVDDQENNLDKIAAFKKFFKEMFSVNEHFLVKKNSRNIRYENNL